MDAIISWLNDKKNLPIIIAGVAVILIVFFVFMFMSGKKKSTDTAADATKTTTATTTASQTAPGMMPGMMPGMPGMTGMGAQTAVAEAPPGEDLPPMLPYRKDPFVPLDPTPIPTKTDRIIAQIPAAPRARLFPSAPSLAETAKEEVLPPQPTRRVAGVMWNGQVSAILETNGQYDVVRPGSVVNKGNSKVVVEKIQSDSIVLKTLDTDKPMTIKVGLAGSPSASTGTSTSAPGMITPTMPGGGISPMVPGVMPGMMPNAAMPGLIR